MTRITCSLSLAALAAAERVPDLLQLEDLAHLVGE
jgi:hypothetical protein